MNGLYVLLDSEFGRTAEARVTPICATLDVWKDGKRQYTTDFWVYENEEAEQALWNTLEDLATDGATIVSFTYTAECRFLSAIGFDPKRFPKAIDLYLEYRMLGNHLADITYGKHLVDGKEKFLKPPPKYKEKEELPEGQSYQQIQFSLASASYKLLGVHRDTKHKDLMRELCIRCNGFTEDEAQSIMEYCREDTVHLRALHEAMWKRLKKQVSECEGGVSDATLMKEQHLRADYARRTALMEDLGYPVDVPAMRRLAANIPYLLRELQRDVNKQLEGVIPFKVFEWDKKTQTFSKAVKLSTDYLEAQYGDMWPERSKETKRISLTKEALEKMASGRHSFRPTLVDQLYRFTNFQQSINGFRPPKDTEKKTIWDSLGSDGRVRPYMGIYTAQSSRTQPAATGFIFLKSAVFRGLVAPRKGRVIVGSDFGQQEFLVAALLSGDKRMIDAYKSGDVYLYFAKATKAVPPDATKKSHPEMRDRYKSSVLGMQFLMASKGLSHKITTDTGTLTTPKQAQAIIDQFDQTFSTYAEWRKERVDEYVKAQRQGYGASVRLGDGWRMWGDNPNFRSVANIPIQGFGAVAMRCAVARAQDAGLEVLFTLHDAIYPEIDFGDWEKIDLFCECMDKGFEDAVKLSFGGKLPAHYTPCRQDPQAWGPDFPEGDSTIETPSGLVVPVQSRYADKRTKEELKRWSAVLWPDEQGDELDI